MTIAEIAQRAGVSKACVSRYLNNGYVSEEKKAKIKQIIEETGYTPSRNAQVLRTGKTGLIGVILPKISSETVSRIAAGISEVLTKNGYRMLLVNTENKVEAELSYLELFKNDQVDGVIFIATLLQPAHRQAIADMKIPVVMVGQRADYVSCVYHNDRACARELTQTLLASGRTRIGYLGVTNKDKAAGAERLAGFREALEEAGLPFDESRMAVSDFSMESGYDTARQLFERAPDTDLVFCATDSIAVGAMQYLKKAGKRVPEEVALAGVGHSKMSGIVSPTLTTAHMFYKTSGMEAASILVDILENGVDMKKQVVLGYEIVEQGSTL